MSQRASKISTIKTYLPALLAGALAPLSLSPIDFWPAAIISVFFLLLILEKTLALQAAKLGWVFGLGFFGVGASWVYVSINVYGNASGIFAAFLTAVFVAALALLFALQCWFYQRYFAGLQRALGFAACWVLFEWLRSWLFTGFPWLYLGYGHINTLLANLAPVLGVLGISFAVTLASGMLYEIFLIWRKEKLWLSKQLALYEIKLLLLGISIFFLGSFTWVEEAQNYSADIALVQANLDQNLKFDPAYIGEGLNLYNGLSTTLWENDIVIWPETAIPLLYQRADAELAYFDRLARENNSSLVTGILYREDSQIYNSMTALGNGSGVYHKQKLVPFGEYVPFAGIMESVLQIFSLPMSSLAAGPNDQALLEASGFSMASYICYEVVYPDFVRKQAHMADFLVTISNDTWFGSSFGPLQHLQMAAMRALENGRYMVRATSNGVTAFINEKGQIVDRTNQFEIATLENTVPIFRGRTPFSYWGSWPIVLFSLLILAIIAGFKRIKSQQE
ncbi:apolipoprotein N-acyltransferase [Gammaproteobacteria bacterium]|nr:apolipoprotein N-acyltransferase [Gammaproteobacteria bacterium]